jgi:PBP1b-binding outer membrane lipoprotein LpoB
MTTFAKLTLIPLAALAVAGCKSKTYENQRPPVDQLDARDRGLQSKDVVNASDQMAMSLLQLPELNVSDRRWTVVFTGVRNQTSSVARQNLDIFVARLKSKVAQQGRGRVQIIANRDTFHETQSRELESTLSERDDYQQGDGRTARPGMAGIQPDFALEAVAMDLANRGTDYYNFEFRLIDLRTREQVWTDMYEVRVAK